MLLGPGDMTEGIREGLGRAFLGWGINVKCGLGLGIQLGCGFLAISLGDYFGVLQTGMFWWICLICSLSCGSICLGSLQCSCTAQKPCQQWSQGCIHLLPGMGTALLGQGLDLQALWNHGLCQSGSSVSISSTAGSCGLIPCQWGL